MTSILDLLLTSKKEDSVQDRVSSCPVSIEPESTGIFCMTPSGDTLYGNSISEVVEKIREALKSESLDPDQALQMLVSLDTSHEIPVDIALEFVSLRESWLQGREEEMSLSEAALFLGAEEASPLVEEVSFQAPTPKEEVRKSVLSGIPSCGSIR